MIQPDIFTDQERLSVVKWVYDVITESGYIIMLIYNVRLSDGNLYKMKVSIYSNGKYEYSVGTMYFTSTDIGHRTLSNKIKGEFDYVLKHTTLHTNKPLYKQKLYHILHSLNDSVNLPDDLYQDMTDRFVAAILKKTEMIHEHDI